MKIVICDDEPPILADMERRIKRYAEDRDIKVQIRKFSNSQDLLDADLSDCDLLFLDIDMPEIDGIEVARQLRARGLKEMILIFVTAFIQYAPESLRVRAYRYILKGKLEIEVPRCMDEVWEEMTKQVRVISVRTKEYTQNVMTRDILYFEGTPARRVLLHAVNRPKPIVCLGKLKEFDEELSGKGFTRLQQSFLANMDHIDWVRNYYARMDNGTDLKISERRFGEVKKEFFAWKGKRM